MFREDEISTSLAPILSIDAEYLDENSFNSCEDKVQDASLVKDITMACRK
jgi:hypothetical protein